MRHNIAIAAVFAFVVWALFAPAYAADIEMRLKVSNGVTEQEHHIQDPEMTPMACIFTAQVAASDWVRKHLGENWQVLRITCGPVRLPM